jgi:hypothetical protein
MWCGELKKIFLMTDQQKELIESIILGDIKLLKKTIPYLKKQGFNFNFENNWAIVMAIAHGHLEIVKILIEEFNISFEEIAKTEAFYRACGRGHAHVVKYLIENSDAFKADSSGLGVAIGQNHQDIIDMLLFYKDNFDGATCSAAQSGRKDILQIIFDHDFHLKDKSYKRAMNWAAQRKKWATVKFILDNGYLEYEDLAEMEREAYTNYLSLL